jgi:tetratricopeptide (TPR) repeat protein
VLERDPSPEVREYVGWQLAQHGIDLARAEELSRAAEKGLTGKLRGLETTAAVTSTTLEDVERLGWTWDAIGWIDFQHGKYEEADGYLRAAWRLLGAPNIAYRLGQLYEKRDKLADAMSYYLAAQALDSAPSPDLVARVRKLAGGGDLPLMLKSARQAAVQERLFALGPSTLDADAYFLAVVDGTRKAIDVTFTSGAEVLKPLAGGTLRSAVFPELLREESPAHLAVRVRVMCSHGNCVASVDLPKNARAEVPIPR